VSTLTKELGYDPPEDSCDFIHLDIAHEVGSFMNQRSTNVVRSIQNICSEIHNLFYYISASQEKGLKY